MTRENDLYTGIKVVWVGCMLTSIGWVTGMCTIHLVRVISVDTNCLITLLNLRLGDFVL